MGRELALKGTASQQQQFSGSGGGDAGWWAGCVSELRHLKVDREGGRNGKGGQAVHH